VRTQIFGRVMIDSPYASLVGLIFPLYPVLLVNVSCLQFYCADFLVGVNSLVIQCLTQLEEASRKKPVGSSR
jgi:hypothetical protein